ncbi:B3/B4 domain-containing protein [Stutzerimonas tarimensis]|uniref:B3/4 domain-containing protein n=1 Tax=Stutzerimonas tarimensis TaxID=1507735 RepID=A0ABV7TA57_9GAMM
MFNPVFCLNAPASLGLKAIAFTLHQLCNQARSEALGTSLDRLRSELQIQASLSQMQGFSDLRLRMGRSPKRFPASPQALLDQYLRMGKLREISPVVDLYNHWSLHSGLSIGAHDLRRIKLPVTLDICQGDEAFHALGSDAAVTLPSGEYAYFDARGQVLCRMEYRQCAATALQADTSAALFIVQGHPDTDLAYLQRTAERLKLDLMRCCVLGARRAANQPLAPRETSYRGELARE